jgi:hypothetical protein
MLYNCKIGSALVFGLALCGPVHADIQIRPGVTRIAAMETVEAVVIKPGVVCPRVQLPSGEEVSLMGFDRSVAVGTKLEMTGQFVSFSNCQQGRTYHVSSFTIIAKAN